MTPDETFALRLYLYGQITKGKLVSSKYAAAAYIFFVQVPGKKNQPCVDYCSLNKVTMQDSGRISVIGLGTEPIDCLQILCKD